jgi:CBS domain-containing protein
MKAGEIMTPNPSSCRSSDSIQEAARLMRDCDCGSVPVVDENDKLIGVVTDRDLAIRGLAEGKGGDTRVSELMTSNPYCSTVDADVREIGRSMADRQIRRVPIVDADGRLAGIIAQADLALAAKSEEGVTEREVAVVVERISEPGKDETQRAFGHAETQSSAETQR